jgi:hypothetical protein
VQELWIACFAEFVFAEIIETKVFKIVEVEL